MAKDNVHYLFSSKVTRLPDVEGAGWHLHTFGTHRWGVVYGVLECVREEGGSDFVLVDLAVEEKEEEKKEEEKEEENTQLRDDMLSLLRLDDGADKCRVGLVCGRRRPGLQ